MFTLTKDYTYPDAAAVKNHAAETCTFTFSLGPDQIPGQGALADHMVQANIEELEKQGSQPLRLRVWEDKSPTFTTNYKVEVTATASPLVWAVVILGLLVILAIAYITYKIVSVIKSTWNPATGGILGTFNTTMMWAVAGIAIIGGVALVYKLKR